MERKRQLAVLVFLVSLLWLAQTPQLVAQRNTGASSATTAVIRAEPHADGQAVSSPPAVIPALPVPRLVKFTGVVRDAAGQRRTGLVGMTFSIYKDHERGATLWMETQNVELDKQGRYTVLLGSTQSDGMPLDLFATGEPRWLGVKVELPDEVEQARVLLVSVPYALKAADADTLGGKPASAFVLAQPEATAGAASTETGTGVGTAAGNQGTAKKSSAPALAATETVNYIPMFVDSAGTLGNSTLYQSSSGNVGIGYTSPNARLLIGAPTGGAVLNATNLADQDMQIALSAPGASDKRTYFGTSTPTNLTLGVGGKEMMRINSAGNVGIGYSNPNARLLIGAPAGGAVLNSTNLADQDMFIALSAPGASDKRTYFGPSTPTNLTLGVGLVEMMRINSAGNVGIGTSTPAAKLDVAGTGNFIGNTTSSLLNVNQMDSGTGSAANFKGSSGNPIVMAVGDNAVCSAKTNGCGSAFFGQTWGSVTATVEGINLATSGSAPGVDGQTRSPNGIGVRGESIGTGGENSYGVFGTTLGGTGVYGEATATTGTNSGVRGFASGTSAIGVLGRALATNGTSSGVTGIVDSPTGIAGQFWNTTGGGNIIVGEAGPYYPANPSVFVKFRIDSSGSVFADGSYNCGLSSGCFNTGVGADVAERIDASEQLEAGDVVEINPDLPGHFRKVRRANSTLVAGIVSTAPGITLGNNDLDHNDTGVRSDQRPLLALVGRVPIKVTDEGGPIRAGDLLTSATAPGYAMRCTDRLACIGAIVGKALEPLQGSRNIIQALVTLQ